MKTVNVEMKLFELSELSEKSKENAINEHYNFLYSVQSPEDFECQKDYEDQMKWLDNFNKDVENYVTESIETNEYLFFESGEMANVTHYCGTHPKAGTTELKFMGEIYDITK